MILNLRVDHKIANIDAMENIAKEMISYFWNCRKSIQL